MDPRDDSGDCLNGVAVAISWIGLASGISARLSSLLGSWRWRTKGRHPHSSWLLGSHVREGRE
jgi:hypothetical protein